MQLGRTLIGPLRCGERYGFIDASGEFVIDPVFKKLGRFSEGYASFTQDGKYGFIDYQGAERIPPIFESDNLGGPTFSSGLAAVGRHGKVGYINTGGDFVIPSNLAAGWDFVGMLAFAHRLVKGQATYQVIDRTGTPLTTLDVCEVPYISNFPTNWDLFGCYYQRNGEMLVGFLDWKGTILFPPQYPWMTDFVEDVAGFSTAALSNSQMCGLVRLSGEIFVEPSFYQISNFQEGLAVAGNTPKRFGFINSRGEWVIEPKYRSARPFTEGLACVSVAGQTTRFGKKGFINQSGEMVIEPRFDRDASFSDGFAQVEYEHKHAVIDRAGRVIWERKIQAA